MNSTPTRAFARLTFSGAVKNAQARYGTRDMWTRQETRGPTNDVLSGVAIAFVRSLDTFVIATSSADGWPHAQHRGGPKGFLRVLDEGRALEFDDYDGNGQFITLGNLGENDRVCLLLIDHATAWRMKIWGHAKVIDLPDLPPTTGDDQENKKRRVHIDVAAWDMNCHKHIKRRFDEETLAAAGVRIQVT